MKRGEIYYIAYDGNSVNPLNRSNGEQWQEIMGGRPAVVISNDIANQKSQLITIVYLTTQERDTIYSRPKIKSSGRTSWAVCEQVSTITVKKVENYCGKCTEEEMKSIEDAIRFHLSLQQEEKTIIKEDTNQNDDIKRELLKTSIERDTYKSMYENLLSNLVPTR